MQTCLRSKKMLFQKFLITKSFGNFRSINLLMLHRNNHFASKLCLGETRLLNFGNSKVLCDGEHDQITFKFTHTYRRMILKSVPLFCLQIIPEILPK